MRYFHMVPYSIAITAWAHCVANFHLRPIDHISAVVIFPIGVNGLFGLEVKDASHLQIAG